MCDFLNIQIDFLIWIQQIRELCSPCISDLFLSITTLGEFFIPTAISCIVYWCIDFKKGIYLLSLCSINLFIAQTIKMIACIYRPWILSHNIHPLPKAIPFAGGYSFPSGHSAMITSCFGGLAIILRHKLFSLLLIMSIFAVMFSRMWLGVHTPQDVIVGFLIGIILVFAIKPLTDFCENDKNRYIIFLTALNIVATILLVIICYKNYPIDYFNGKIIVNSLSSKYYSIVGFAYSLGLLNGAILCRRFFQFETNGISLKIKFFRSLFGLTLLKCITIYIEKNFISQTCDFKFTFIIIFFLAFFITGIYPIIFKSIEKQIKSL